MFDRIFGNYLVSKGRITSNELESALEKAGSSSLKLGVIAVAEHLMTEEQADEVNRIQAVTDKRFGDIAIEKGYLTDDQIGALLKRQGNRFMKLMQAIIDSGSFTWEDIDALLEEYQNDMGFTHSDMDNLVSGDIIKALEVFLPRQDELYTKLCGIALRTIVRLIDSNAYFEKAYMTDEFAADKYAYQVTDGQHTFVTGFAGDGNSLLSIAEPFGMECFEEVDLDALDAVAEFINCIDGLLATELSMDKIDVDMLPPEFADKKVVIKGEKLCVLPVYVNGSKVNLITSVDGKIEVN